MPNQFDGHFNNNNSTSSQSRIGVDNLLSGDKSNGDFGVCLNSKKSPSPLYNFKQQREKENIQSKRDLFSNNQRSGSGRRAYLSNNQQK